MCWQPQLALPKLEQSSARSTGAAAVVSRAERGVGVSASPVTHNASFFFSESYPSFPCFSFNLSFFCSCPALVLALCPPGERRACIYNHEHVFTLLPLLTLCSTGLFNIDYDSGRPASPNFLAFSSTRAGTAQPVPHVFFLLPVYSLRHIAVAELPARDWRSTAARLRPAASAHSDRSWLRCVHCSFCGNRFSQLNNVLGAARVLL